MICTPIVQLSENCIISWPNLASKYRLSDALAFFLKKKKRNKMKVLHLSLHIYKKEPIYSWCNKGRRHCIISGIQISIESILACHLGRMLKALV